MRECFLDSGSDKVTYFFIPREAPHLLPSIGVANKTVHPPSGLSGRSLTGNYLGTPLVIPSEQIANFKYVKPVSGVWSLAATPPLCADFRSSRSEICRSSTNPNSTDMRFEPIMDQR